MRHQANLILLALFWAVSATAQDNSEIDKMAALPSGYYHQLTKKLDGKAASFDKKSKNYLRKIARSEKKMYKAVWKKDSLQAKILFGDVSKAYRELPGKALQKTRNLDRFSRVYSNKLDSLSTALTFLDNNSLLKPELRAAFDKSRVSINGLQEKLDQNNLVKNFLTSRKEQLSRELTKLGLLKDLKKFNKQLFYYQQQLQEFRELLNDPSKLEGKLLEAASHIPAFREFFNQHSTLAGLFRLPGSPNANGVPLTGLQTKESLSLDMLNRFGSEIAVKQTMQKNMQEAREQLGKIRKKFGKTVPQGEEASDLQSFKPNNQKTKSFWKRLELGSNLQSQRSTSFLPVTSDIGLSLGYKLNDRSILGLGASYKMGWGQNIRNIHFTHEGVSLRSFVDWKLKGSFYVSGGYEMNYRSAFQRIEELKPLNAWQQSGLLGISKIVSFRSKLFKKTKIQCLYDFLHSQQIPDTQPLIFRIGYNF
jgi:hypothetical protein